MRVKIGLIFAFILSIVSCAPTTAEPVPTATTYSPVSPYSAIPLVYEPITQENAEMLTLLAHWQIDTRAENLVFSQNQEILCAGTKDVEHSWDLFGGSISSITTDCQMPFPNNNFGKKAITSDNHYSADIESGSGILYIVDLLKPTSYLYYYLDDTVSVGFSSSGQYLAIAFQNGEVWFVQKSEWLDGSNYLDLRPELTINTGKVPLQILFSPNDSLISILSQDQTIQIWNVSNLSLLLTLNGLIPSTFPISKEPSSNNFTNELPSEESQVRVYKMAFSSDGNILATAHTDNSIRLWDIQTGRLLVKLKGHKDNVPISSLVFSRTNRLLASLYNGYFIYIWGILPDDLEKAKANSTAIAYSASNPIVILERFPQPTATPTSSLPTYQSQIPLGWPVEMPTMKQILEAKECPIEASAKSRYPEEMLYWDFEYAYPLESPCDWAILAIAYQSRIEKRDVISEEGKRAFFQAVQQNSALAMNEAILYPYFDSFELVDAPPLAGQPITSITIDYEWSGIGEPSHIEYFIEIENTQLSSDEVKISVKSQPEKLKNNLSHSLNPEKIQEIRSSLTDFLPVQVPFTLEPCTDNSPDWNITVNFLNGKSITLTTHHSNLLTAGGPWFMELDGQFYIQFSAALTQAIMRLFDSLGLPLGQPYSMFCSHTNTIELAFP